MMRTAEVVYVGNPEDLLRAQEKIRAGNAATSASSEASGKRTSASWLSSAGAAKKAAAEIEASGGRIGSTLTGIGRSGNVAVAGIVAVGAAVEGVKHSAGTLAELAKETRALHTVTGLNTESASAYAAVAKTQDVPVKALNQSLGTLSKNVHMVENAHSGAAKAAHTQETALRQLGLPMADITKDHGDLNKLLPQIIKRFEEMPGGIAKTQVGMALFGRGWQTLVPLMKQGELGLTAQLKIAKEMGATLSGSTAKQVAEYAKEQERAKYATLGLNVAVGKDLAPQLVKLIRVETDVVHGLGEGVHWLEEHSTAAKIAAGVIGGTLGLALTVFAYSKAKKFVEATKDMTGGISAFVRKVVGSSAAVDASFAGEATAAESAAVTTAAAQEGLAAKVAATDDAMIASNAAAGRSWMALLGPIGAAVAAVAAAEPLINKATGGGLGETEAEGKAAHNWGGTQKNLDTGGGIMAFFMSKGLSAAQAAGIVGNVQQESGLNPKAPGGGFFQDIGPRAASGTGSSLHQLEAAWKELTTSERATLELIKKARTPEQAARIFSERFERPGEPMLSNRERYAREAYGAHPQGHHAASKAHEQTGNLGYFEAGEKKAEKQTDGVNPENNKIEWHTAAEWRKIHNAHTQKAAAGKGAASSTAIDKWAEQHVGKFAESWGKNTGPELDVLQKEFHTRAAAWCAEFATTAAMMGGANKAVRTASVATIREWAEAGTHGYKKGVSSTPHVGDMMMFGNSHVGFVQSVHGDKVTTIEGNTSGGKVEVEHRSASEGTFASPIYHNLKTGKVLLEKESAAYAEAVKRAEKLMLTAGQRLALHAGVAGAGEAHATREHYASAASEIGSFLSARQARWALQKPDLTTASGRKAAHDRDETVVLTKQSEKKYLQRELKAITAEARNWAKVRDSYTKLARHQHGGAKREALKKAAEFDGKVKQAQIDAKALEGTISDTETGILEAEAVRDVTLPEEIAQATQTAQSNDLSAYSAANSKVDAEARAGLLGPDKATNETKAKELKEANARKALAGGYGALSEEGILQVKGDLKEFSEALTSATDALNAHTQAVLDNTKAQLEKAQVARGIAEVETGVTTKALADIVSGEIGGRAQVAGSGRGFSGARY